MALLPRALKAHSRTFFSFGAIQAMQLALPLLAFPWLGRILGPEAFGLLMYMCLIPPIVNLVMDWGLPLASARDAARERASKSGLVVLLGNVFTAKILLALLCAAGGLAAYPLLPHVRGWALAYCLAVLTGVCRGINPVWFFQGTGQGMRAMAVYDVGSSLLALGLVFIFIHQPADWPLYLLFSAACKGWAYLWLNFRLWQNYRPRLTLKGGLRAIGDSGMLFGASFFSMVNNNGTQLLMGYFLPASEMGIIVAVNKMLRALVSLTNPFTQTIFPEICALRKLEPERTRHILRYSFALTILLMLLATGVTWLLAPWLIRAALGPEYANAAPVMRIMLVAAPFMAANFVLGSQTLVPFDQEKSQMLVLLASALLGLCLVPPLCSWLGMAGGALVPVCVEAFTFAGCILAVIRTCPRALF